MTAPAAGPRVLFIGVSTAGSTMIRLFPHWARELGRPEVALEGVDLPLDAPPAAYRAAVERIRRDRLALGALITSHKLALVAAARDQIDELDPLATLCGEASSLSKRNGRLIAHAKDPITSGVALAAIAATGYFSSSGAHVLCLGAGGAATAIAIGLARLRDASDRPPRFLAVDRRQDRLDALRSVIARAGAGGVDFDFRLHTEARANDAAMASLPRGSLVINATGMGKDLPGSPITGEAVFPLDGAAWELNYRGELAFLRQARAQQAARRLRVEDGWLYFLHGWAQVLAEVLAVEVGPERFARLARIADEMRG